MPKDGTITAEVRLRITMATAAFAGLISRLLTSSSISFHLSTGFSSPTLSPSYCTAATLDTSRGNRTQDTGLSEQVSPKTARYLLPGAQYQIVRPEHDSSTYWPTRTPPNDSQTTKSGFVFEHVTGQESLCKNMLTKPLTEVAVRRPEEKLW
ncbi:hypothetical protein DPMN_020931 [Dreissena polymorpha]|uniref:Uncharacterized protein n=1 Tax=Dreissena polymorpha TaxID=45954 RepID=A0A9D4NL77_DREPO|nr:hypothetical protein DPMN_020931 [Dreissena polymorpha]